MPARECSRTACSRPAVSTLTYVYADSTAVLGPLARASEPHTYDLCREHSESMTAPRGWRVIRIPGGAEEVDDLVAIAEALSGSRRAQAPEIPGPRIGTGSHAAPRPAPAASDHEAAERRTGTGRRLHVVRSSDE